MAKLLTDFDAYRRHFALHRLWNKLRAVALKAGEQVVYHALLLYYVTQDPAVPATVKLKIYGALGYFIVPADLIPDMVAALGFSDDLAALTWAVYTVSGYITPEMERKARLKAREWLNTAPGPTVTVVETPPATGR